MYELSKWALISFRILRQLSIKFLNYCIYCKGALFKEDYSEGDGCLGYAQRFCAGYNGTQSTGKGFCSCEHTAYTRCIFRLVNSLYQHLNVLLVCI